MTVASQLLLNQVVLHGQFPLTDNVEKSKKRKKKSQKAARAENIDVHNHPIGSCGNVFEHFSEGIQEEGKLSF